MRYREFQIILEYDRSKSLKKSSVAVAKAAANDPSAKGQTAEQLFDRFEQADPTQNKQYVEWLVSRYSNGQYQLDRLPSITQALVKFDRNKQQFAIKDINQYKQAGDLIQAVNSIKINLSNKQQKNQEKEKAYKESEIIYSGNDGILVSPKTEFSSCWFGRNTNFCTARTKTKNSFDDYNRDGDIYLWMPRNEGAGAKIQMFLPNNDSDHAMEISDSSNKPIQSETFRDKYLRIPPIHLLIKKYANRQLELGKVTDYDNQGLDLYVNYLQEPLPVNKVELLKYFPRYIAPYAKYIAKKRMPELEETVLDDVWNAIKYAKLMIGPWPALEKRILEEIPMNAEHAIAAVDYAINVLNKPWPAVEKYILKERHEQSTVMSYAKAFYPNGWPKLAASILAAYSRSYLNKSDAFHFLVLYATEIKNNNWPAAENLLITDTYTTSDILYSYAKHVLNGPWPKAEEKMLSEEMQEDDRYLAEGLRKYAIDILNKRWPEAEPIIKQDRYEWNMYIQHFGSDNATDFQKGQTVKVTQGPFKDFEGVVTDVEDNQVYLNISIFGRNVQAKFDTNQVESASGRITRNEI